MPEVFLSPQDVAEALGVEVQTVRRWIHTGELRAFQPGKKYRVAESDLAAFMQKAEVRPKGEASPPSEARAGERRLLRLYFESEEGRREMNRLFELRQTGVLSPDEYLERLLALFDRLEERAARPEVARNTG